MIEEFRAEEERRSRLTLKERMAEDGREIQRRLEREPTMTILLQPSPPRHMRRAQCLAGECPIVDTSPRDEGRIMDDYRIVFVSDDREYFHISCLEKMIRLPSLAPSRFKLDREGYQWNNGWPWTWGLMLRKWFEHSGCINLAKIAEYIDAYKTFQRANGDFSTQHVEWQLTHIRECTADRGSCGCPPEPEGPIEPTLEDYKTEKESSLSRISVGLLWPKPASMNSIPCSPHEIEGKKVVAADVARATSQILHPRKSSPILYVLNFVGSAPTSAFVTAKTMLEVC